MMKLVSERNSNENDLLSLSLDEVVRHGAQKLLVEALELEVQDYINRCAHLKDDNGHRLVVRNGKHKGRNITTGAGPIPIEAPRVNDKRENFQFNSLILPRYLRKSPNVEAILPILYLKGLSGNAFADALKELLGEGANGLSSSSISILKRSWIKEMEDWNKREITDNFIYLWADGVNIKVRLGEDKKMCLLVLIGVTASGEKKLVAVEGGYRESKDSWKLVFRDLIKRGLKAPLLIIGDGALGLWSAIKEIDEFKTTKEQRCWIHKIANVLDKLPKRLQLQAKKLLHDMMNANTEKDAEITSRIFQNEFHEKFPKAVKCLTEDWEQLTAFFKFPGFHWGHIKSTNPIESTFATVKQRMNVTKGVGSKEMACAMAFKLMLEGEKRWAKIRGFKEIENLLLGKLYKDGKIVVEKDVIQEEVA